MPTFMGKSCSLSVLTIQVPGHILCTNTVTPVCCSLHGQLSVYDFFMQKGRENEAQAVLSLHSAKSPDSFCYFLETATLLKGFLTLT